MQKNLFTESAEIIVWVDRSAISFDPEKSELQYFTQAPKPMEYSSCNYAGKELQAIQSTEWLSI